jgi:nitroreductase
MTLSEAIRARRSIRRYTKAEVTQEQIDAMLEAAMMAPSGNNSRSWEFIVVKNRAKLDTIAKIHPYAKMVKEAALVIIVCGLPKSEFMPQDCGAATENILLQAVDLGLGTCWCGVYPNEARMKEIKDALNIKGMPFNVIAVGVPDESPPARGSYEKQKVTYL